MKLLHSISMLVGLALALLSVPVAARVDKIIVHGRSLEGNLERNSVERTVFVLLPPGYQRNLSQRYPVVYFLHGYNSTAEGTLAWTRMEQRLSAAMAASKREFIVVAPDSNTLMGGSMYSNSVTVGDFEDFISKDLIGWIDSHYRTIAGRKSRGLFGHSMGGYGTLRIAMKHPELFSVIYALNPCCLLPRVISAGDGGKFEDLTPNQVAEGDFMTRANFAVAAAWSPDPGKPPFYADLATTKGKIDPLVLAKWAANAPTAMLPQYLPAIRSLKALGLETGINDFVRPDVEAMHSELLRFGIAHQWTVHDGDHGNRVSERLESVVFPFFAKNLVFVNGK